jgi:transketolase
MKLLDTIKFSNKIRLHALNMTSKAGTSHIGSMLSIADIVAVLFNGILNMKSLKKNKEKINRDYFILSKGHAGGIVYAALAEKGFFPINKLDTYCKNGSTLSGHISHYKVAGVDFSSGSLGHGLSVSCGLALANSRRRIFNLMSDGELDEGSNWESILFASHHKLSNLVNIIDYNKIQSIKSIKDTLNLEPLKKKWEAFGWKVLEVDGHNHKKIFSALQNKSLRKPLCLICHTIKGKGVDFMERNNLWHYRTARGDEYQKAKIQIEKKI